MNESPAMKEHEHGPHHEKDRLVAITVNGAKKEIRPGVHTVPQIKTLGGVPQTDLLNQVIHGKLHPLPDDGSVTIKGGEAFVSCPKDSSSS